MLLPNRGMHPPQHVLSERLQLSHYACRLRLPLDHEPPVSGLPAIVREPQKVEGLRAPLPGGRSAANRPNAISRVLPSWTDRPNCASLCVSAPRSSLPSVPC